MTNRYLRSLLTSALSIIPIIVIVYILVWSKVATIRSDEYLLLFIGALILIAGLALFQIGAATGLTKVGEYMGSSLSKQKKIFIVVLFAFLLGALITCAEPSILIVSTQININKYLLIGSIALGVGIFTAIGIIRVFMRRSLKLWYLFFYFIVFAIICLLQVDPNNAAYLPFIFDAGGITTGSATVPFILALGAGVAVVRGGKNSNEDSFGLVGIASIGPIITMTILILANNSGFKEYIVTDYSQVGTWERFKYALLYTNPNEMGSLIDVCLALAPIIVIFLIYNFIYIKLPAGKLGRLLIGFFFSYIGLVLFLTGVGAVMSPIGLEIGQSIGAQANWVIILIAFILGLVTILCEPAVHVLTNQINEISEGNIKKKTVLIALSIGVGIAICLSAIRTVYHFSIMYYIVPGYLLSLALMFVCPNLFTSIAFDSGGTASGPMAVSFVLPFIVGITSNRNGVSNEVYQTLTEAQKQLYSGGTGWHNLMKSNIFYEQSFGVVAMIALTPILAIQILGVVANIKKHSRIRMMRLSTHDESNNKIINF